MIIIRFVFTRRLYIYIEIIEKHNKYLFEFIKETKNTILDRTELPSISYLIISIRHFSYQKTRTYRFEQF